jgi:type IV pilus assembly protein PilF
MSRGGLRAMPRVRTAGAAVLGVAASLLLASCGGTSPQRAEPTRAETAGSLNLQLGIAYLQQGNLALAKEKLDRAMAQNPRDPIAHSARALLAEKLGNEREAERLYRSAVRLAPDSPDISNSFAVFLCRTGRVDEGVKRFNEVARNPLYRNAEVAYTNAGVCQRGAGKLDEASSNFARALAIRPNHAEAVFQLADLDLARGRAADASAVLERFLAAFRPTPDLLFLGVRIARELGDRGSEERYARRLRVEYPDSEQLRKLTTLPPRKTG